LLAAFAVVLVLVPAAGAGPGGLRVLAATSLATVLPKIDAHERYTFAGSSKLAAPIEAGTHADVFVSANTSDPAALHAKGLVSTPVVFAHNTVAVIVPAKNAAHIRTLGAGFVYASDAQAAGRHVKVIAIPARAQLNVAYAVAVVLSSSRRSDARAFVTQLRSSRAQAALRAAGFR
jgi:ABC-type molybdate transport system substrate-binding protein